MSARPIAILATGLVTSVGMTAAESCAAFRAKLSNPSETRFADTGGDWIMAHQVPLDMPWRGLTRLAKLAALAIDEALQSIPQDEWHTLPLLLCVAEAERPGRMAGLNDELLPMIQAELGVAFSSPSAIVAHGRASVAVALAQARSLQTQAGTGRVLVVAVDSLLSSDTLSYYEQQQRLLTASNSNGFMPGEAAGALLVGTPLADAPGLLCAGIGFARETAHIDSEEPLRADGLSDAIKGSLNDAGLQMGDMDFRIADCSGEHYYFKEAALALSRTLRKRKEEFDIWHPAECTGEVGAAAGITVLATAHAACQKGYTKGPNLLTHWANDAGQRAAVALHYRTA